MLKKISYFTLALFTLGANALAASSAGIPATASHVGAGFPESGSLALLGSALIFGATFLRKKLAGNAK
jgi:hypothetical protein